MYEGGLVRKINDILFLLVLNSIAFNNDNMAFIALVQYNLFRKKHLRSILSLKAVIKHYKNN